jgi:hypothetical protein
MESLARRNSRRIVTEKSINCIVHLKEVQFIFYKTIEIIIRLEITYVQTTYRIYMYTYMYIPTYMYIYIHVHTYTYVYNILIY